MNDTVFVCGSPTFQNVETADPSEDWYEDGGGCSGSSEGRHHTHHRAHERDHAYTSLSVQALGQAAAKNDTFTIGLGSTTQTVTLSAAAASGATSISVNSFTTTSAYPTGTPLNDNATGHLAERRPCGERSRPTTARSRPTPSTNGCVYQGPTTIT